MPADPSQNTRPASACDGFPPTALLGRDTAATSLRFYAGRFERGETTRWDLAAHLMLDAAAEIERLRAIILRMVRESNDCAEPCRSARERGLCGCTEEAKGEMARG